jgi:hypothetical protein
MISVPNFAGKDRGAGAASRRYHNLVRTTVE